MPTAALAWDHSTATPAAVPAAASSATKAFQRMYVDMVSQIRTAARPLSEDPKSIVINIVNPLPMPVTRLGRVQPPAWVFPTLDAISRLSQLGTGWDGYGAPAIHPGAVVGIVSFLVRTARPDTPPPAVVPTGSGSIQLEWRCGPAEIDVEINAEGGYDAFYEGPDGEFEWQGESVMQVDHELARRIAAIRAVAPVER